MSAVRTPPQAIEAEQSVLGSILLDNRAYWRIADTLREEDFYRRDHRVIYAAIRELAQADTPVEYDHITLGEVLEAKGIAEQAGGTGYLVELASTTPSASNVRAYADIVREKAVMRRLIEAGTEIVNAGLQAEGRSADELIAHAGNVVSEVRPSGVAKGGAMLDITKAMFVELSEQFENGEQFIGIETGFADIDEAIGGMQNGRVYGIGARAKMGKTTLADNITDNIVARGIPGAKWSLEMSEKESAKRSLCALASIDNLKMLRPSTLEEDDWSRINVAVKAMSRWPLTVFASRARVTLERIQAQAMQLKAQGKLRFMVIDYLGLMSLPNAERHDIAIGKVTGGLKTLAAVLDVPIILVFQLNRGNEQGNQVRPPRPSDARDSGNIEQDLDVMILLHRPSYYDPDAQKGTRCHIALNRNGPTKVIRLEDDLAMCRFRSSPIPWSDRAPDGERKTKAKPLDEGF